MAWGDLAYRVYTTALAALVLAVFASGFVGDREVDTATAADVRHTGAAWAGLAVGIAVLSAVRSGSRGGPLALEASDVHHLLLSPADRSTVLRRPVAGVLGYGIGGAAIAGGLAGSLLAQRLPGSNSEWVLTSALFAATAAALALGAALVTASRRVPTWIPVVVAAGLVGWSVLDVTDIGPAAPLGVLGSMPFWPLRFTPWSLAAVLVAVLLAVLGARWVGGLSIEAARRRTQLVGQLRFAVTQQDLRSVLLLRRQLAAERPRSRPLARVPRALGRRAPVLARGLQSYLRWPSVRIVRVLALGVVCGLALRGVWAGTTPLLIVAGVAAYLAALDALEPLAQAVDHPTLMASYPAPKGLLLVHHLTAPSLLMLGLGAVGVVAAWVVAPSARVLGVGAITAVSAALSGVAGAAVSVVSEVVLDQSGAAMLPAEVAGPRVVIRTLWPPIVATIGGAPVLAAQRAVRNGIDVTSVTLAAAGAALALVAVIVTWVRYREDLHRSMAEAMGAQRPGAGEPA